MPEALRKTGYLTNWLLRIQFRLLSESGQMPFLTSCYDWFEYLLLLGSKTASSVYVAVLLWHLETAECTYCQRR